MEKWTRYMRSYNINGVVVSSGVPLDVTSEPHVYKTDEAISYASPTTPGDSRYLVSKADGTYYWRTTWSKQSGSPAAGDQAIETRIVVTVLGDDIEYCGGRRAGPVADIDSLPFTDTWCEIWDDNTNVYLYFEHKLPIYIYGTGYDESTENEVGGTYTVELTNPTGTTSLGTFEYRVFGTSIVPDGEVPPDIDPNHPEQPVGGLRSYRAFSLPTSFDWMPTGNGLMRIRIKKSGSTIDEMNITLDQAGLSSQIHDGYFYGFFSGWDARNKTTGEISEGLHTVELAAILPVEGGVHTYSTKSSTLIVLPLEVDPPTEEHRAELLEDECGCGVVKINYTGQSSNSLPASSASSPIGDIGVSLTNRSAISSKSPASLGYGWGLSGQEKITAFTNISDYIRHDFNSGQFEIWKLVEGSYVALRADNKTVLEESMDGSFLMTFENQAERRFRPLDDTTAPGAIDWKKDRNGNTVHFHYDSNGLLTALSDEVDGNGDPDGRITRLSYQNPTVDPQPYKVTSEVRVGGVLQGARDTTFQFYTTTNISQGHLEGRIQSVENAESETLTYRYYADDEDFRYGHIHQILDARGHVVKELDYHNDSRVRVKKETSFYDSGTGIVPEFTREFEYGTISEVTSGSWLSTTIIKNYTKTVTSTDHTGRSAYPAREVKYTLNALRVPTKIETTIGEDTNVTEFEYNDATNPRRVTKHIDPNLKYEEYTYNSLGNVLTSRNKEGEITTIAYKSSDPNLVESITAPEVTVPDPQNPGQTITEQYEVTFGYDAKGNLNSITDPNNRTTYLRLRNGVDHAATDGQIWKIVNKRWDGSPSTEDDHATIFTYYSNGDLESIQTPAGPGSHPGTKITLEYDVFGNVNKVTDLLGNEWKTVFDDVNRAIEQEDARGKKSYFDYTDGLLTGVGVPPNEGPSGTQSFDIGGSRQARLSVFSHDYRGRVTEVESYTSSSTTETRAAYEYTGFSEMHKLIRLIDTYNKTTEWSYDQLGRVVEMVDDLGRSTTRTYEPFCVEFQQTTARGIVSTHTFDELCRPKTMLAPSRDFAYSYDELGRLIEITQDLQDSRYNDNGAKYDVSIFGGKYSSGNAPVTNVRFGTARYTPTSKSWTFEYDSLSRMTKVIYPDGEEITYSYGHEGELLEVSDADGKITKYEYNNDLSVYKVILERGGIDVAEFVYTYDAGGRVEKIVYPDGIEVHFDDGGSPAQSGWSPNGQLTHVRYLKDDGMSGLELVRSYQYTYDDSGNRTQMIESNGTPSQDIEWQYRYDWFDRLVQVKRGVGGVTPSIQREYTFDESDNRTYVDDYVNNRTLWYTYKTVGSGSAIKYSDEIAEVLIASGTGKRAPTDINDFTSLEKFVSDDDGNIIQRSSSSGRINYEWDDSNNLLSVNFDNGNSTQNVYDPGSIREETIKNSGERVKSFFSGLPTINEESTTAGNDISYFPGHQLLGFEKNGNNYYFVTDGLSSVRAVLDSSGNEVATYEHDEYGNELSSSGSLANPKTFVGGLGVHDDTAESQLLYMRRRHYDAGLGRFISKDPIGISGGLNLFNYPTNPISAVDPTGLQPAEPKEGECTVSLYANNEHVWVQLYGPDEEGFMVRKSFDTQPFGGVTRHYGLEARYKSIDEPSTRARHKVVSPERFKEIMEYLESDDGRNQMWGFSCSGYGTNVWKKFFPEDDINSNLFRFNIFPPAIAYQIQNLNELGIPRPYYNLGDPYSPTGDVEVERRLNERIRQYYRR